jgi:hypothetical protein
MKFDRRSPRFISFLQMTLWPIIQFIFRIEIEGELPQGKVLMVSNHNIGALIESHSLLFLLHNKPKIFPTFGFTHPFIFKIWGARQYFEWLGAVPATYEVAEEVLKTNNTLLIFPGGNRQAVRSVWEYKKNNFLWSSGWAKIALKNKVLVVPITFKNSHFVNPVLFTSKTLATLLVLPRFLGVKWMPVSISQILFATLMALLMNSIGAPIAVTVLMSYLAFVFSVLIPVIPVKIKIKFHPVIATEGLTQEILENRVSQIMDLIYISS